MDYTDIEKESILLKMEWEGGLIEFMNYGLPTKLYQLFKVELDEIYKFIEKTKYTNKQNFKINTLEDKITEFLNQRTVSGVEYTDEELNSVDYVFE